MGTTIRTTDKDYHTSLLGGFPTFKFPTHSLLPSITKKNQKNHSSPYFNSKITLLTIALKFQIKCS